MTYVGPCFFCPRPVTTGEGVAYGVIGWESARAQGGTNHVLLRQRVPEKVAHLSCVRERAELHRRGVAFEQDVLDLT